jgi:hypothetical protein
MAPLCGFRGTDAVGISLATSISKASLIHLTENRHEIRDPDAQQPFRRLRCALRVDLGSDVGLDLCDFFWKKSALSSDGIHQTE